MGDAGSNFLEMARNALVVGTYIIEPFGPVLLFSSTLHSRGANLRQRFAITRAWLQGKSPFKPDKNTSPHRLVQLGLSTKHAVLLIYLVTATTAMSGILLYFLMQPPIWSRARRCAGRLRARHHRVARNHRASPCRRAGDSGA